MLIATEYVFSYSAHFSLDALRHKLLSVFYWHLVDRLKC